MRRPTRVALGGVALLLAAGCGLPLPAGVTSAKDVAPEQARAGDIQVLPPGPSTGASPERVVEGFLGAQVSAQGGHAVARSYLLPGTAWDDSAGVQVYEPTSLVVQPAEASDVLTVTATRTGRVGPDGSYAAAQDELTDTYEVRKDGAGQWRLSRVPSGLRLTRTDLLQSFAPADVHFLAPSYGQASTTGHLVADREWLPVGPDRAERLVRALLAGPTGALGGSVTTAVPPGTGLRRVGAAPDGTVAVDLTGPARALPEQAREQLSAQLVWTLRALGPAFVHLRLLLDGRPLNVAGSTAPQDVGDWQEFDPERLRPRAPAFYLARRQLRSLDGGLTSNAATDGRLAVDTAAVSPDGALALISGAGPAAELRTGPRTGPFVLRLRGELSSPSWGSGDQGLWVLRREGGRTRLLLVPPQGPALNVAVDLPAGGGRVRAWRVARDGVHVALVLQDGALLVGRLERRGGGPAVSGLHQTSPGLSGVTAVAWLTGTELVAIARVPALGLAPVRLTVDGSTPVTLTSRLGAGVVPLSVAAAEGRPVVLAGRTGTSGVSEVFQDQGGVFVAQVQGTDPVYPG